MVPIVRAAKAGVLCLARATSRLSARLQKQRDRSSRRRQPPTFAPIKSSPLGAGTITKLVFHWCQLADSAEVFPVTTICFAGIPGAGVPQGLRIDLKLNFGGGDTAVARA